MNKRIAFFIFSILIFLLVACGTVEVGIEPAATNDTPALAATEVAATPTSEPAAPTATSQPEVAPTATDEPQPTATSEPQPTATTAVEQPIETIDPLVAYIKDGNIWLWSPSEGARLLHDSIAEIESARISPDGQQVAYIRDGVLWSIQSDGQHNREMTPPFNLASIHETPGVRIYRYSWMPDSETILYNTAPPSPGGPGLFVSNNLWAIHIRGQNRELLGNDGGGDFYPSPDGSRIAVVQPGKIQMVNGDGSDLRTIFTHPEISTYSEAPFYARPRWSADGRTIGFALPPVAALEQPDAETQIWLVDVDGNSQQLLARVPFAQPFGDNVLFAPNLATVAYLQAAADENMPATIAFADVMTDVLGEPAQTNVAAETLNGWSPDGRYIVYTPPFGGTPLRRVLGRDGAIIPLGDESRPIVDATWIDATRLIVTRQNGSGVWELVLRDLHNGDLTVLDTVSGAPPLIDWAPLP